MKNEEIKEKIGEIFNGISWSLIFGAINPFSPEFFSLKLLKEKK